MHWLVYSLLATIFCATYSAALADSSTKTKETALNVKDNEKKAQPFVSDFFFTDPSSNSTQKAENNTIDAFSLTTDEKRDVENITFNDLKPLLLFPILPFLFPPREEELRNETKNESTRNSIGGKPFIFFDFAFNIRNIPIANFTDSRNDSKIINIKELSDDNVDDPNQNSLKNRRRRNSKLESSGFFDDAPLFPDSELDEFLPKSDLFFPDLPFHHKPVKKLSRRKRGQKKTEMKSDFKSFFDAFDEAFMRTKRELEWTDPILNFLRGGEQTFEEDKKEADDLFSPVPGIQEKPSVKWRIQRNIKRMNKDHEGESRKAHGSPTIIVDKVVKIGEFHVPNDANKSKKKRQMIDSEWKSFEKDTQDQIDMRKNEDAISKSIFDLFKKDKNSGKKINHAKNSKTRETTYEKLQSQEKRNAPEIRSSFLSLSKAEPEAKNADANNTEKFLHLMNMFDSLRGKMQVDLQNVQNKTPIGKKEKPVEIHADSKTAFQDDLKKNLTSLLKQFLELNQNLNKAKLVEKIEVNERDEPKVFDWTEKETLQNTNVIGGGSKGRRQKKDAYFEDEYGNSEKKERQVADLNTLFLNVTVPTIIFFSVILVACFYGLQVKGKICTKLFKPRQILIINDEATAQLKNPGVKKIQAI